MGAKALKKTYGEELAGAAHAAGCVSLLLFAAVYIVGGFGVAYRLAMLGAVAASAAEVYALMLRNGNNAGALAQAEEAPYAFLAVALYLMPATASVLPAIMLRALTSVVSWARSSAQLRGHPTYRTHVAPALETLAKYQGAALQAAAGLEVLVLPWLIVTVWRTGMFLPLCYALFLRLQYVVSPRTRLAVASLDDSLTRVTAHPSCPPGVRAFYANARTQLASLVVRSA